MNLASLEAKLKELTEEKLQQIQSGFRKGLSVQQATYKVQQQHGQVYLHLLTLKKLLI